MSKIVTMARSLGDYLPRYDGKKFQKTGSKTIQTATIIVPDKRANLIKRVGKYKVEDNNVPTDVITEFTPTILPSDQVFHDENYELSVANQNEATIEQVDEQTYKVIADPTKLNSFDSSDPNQGNHKWIGIAIDTGETTIVGITFNGHKLTEDDVEEAAEVQLSAGNIIYWYKYDLDKSIIVLEKDGKSTAITILSETK